MQRGTRAEALTQWMLPEAFGKTLIAGSDSVAAGLLITLPVLNASVYRSYRDI